MAEIKKSYFFEEYANSDSMDFTGRVIDSTTTVDGLLKIVAEELIFKEDVLAGIKIFRGQILRVVTLSKADSEYSNYSIGLRTAIDSNNGTITAYVVRVPGIHSLLPIPDTYGTEPSQQKDKKIIDLYKPYFLGKPGTSYSLGDFVEVTFGNITTFTDGTIVNTFTPKPQGQGTVSPKEDKKTELSQKPSETFKTPPTDSKEGAIDPNDPQVFLSKGSAWKDGKDLGKIKVKKISGDFYLEVNAANDFLNMNKQFVKEKNKNLTVTSAFREDADQAKLYKKFLDGTGNTAASPASGLIEGKSTYITKGGKKVEIKKGSGRHQYGIAVDINVEKSYKSETYQWLHKNASSYNYYNYGKYYTSEKNKPGEPWHWENYPKDNKRVAEFLAKEGVTNKAIASKSSDPAAASEEDT